MYEVNERDYEVIKALSLYGAPHELIASYLGISRNTLLKYYKELLDNCKENKNGAMEMALYVRGIKGNVDAQKYWLSNHKKDVYGGTKMTDSGFDAAEVLREIADNLPD